MERRQSFEDLTIYARTFSPSTPSSSPPRAASEPPSSPSSPLSVLSRTPSPPNSPAIAIDAVQRYPSPISLSTDKSGTQTPVKRADRSSSQSDDGSTASGRPAKRRRTINPKEPEERTTKYLNLTKPQDAFTPYDTQQLDRLVGALRKKKKIVVIAGAGISVSAGIPDFRSSNGLFATTKKQYNVKSSGKHLFDASVYKHDSSTQSFHNMVRDMSDMSAKAAPTPFHHMLASLAQEGRLLRLYSQNIDCLDTQMEPLETAVPLNLKGPWPKTVQLHGGLRHMVCTKCSELSPFKAEIFDGPEAPLCAACQEMDDIRTNHGGKRSHGIGRLRPRFVLYNEFNPDGEAIGNVSSADLRTRPDAIIVVGTTLKVPGTRRLVKELCQVTRGRKDGFTAWINLSPEPKGVDLKDCWDMVVQSKCDNVARLVALPPWNVDIGDDYLIPKDELADTAKTNIEINLPSTPPEHASEELIDSSAAPKPTADDAAQAAMPTPKPSPKLAATKKPQQAKLAFDSNSKNTKTTTTTTKPKKATKPRPRKPKQDKKVQLPPPVTAMDGFKTGKKFTNTSKTADAKMATKDALSVDTTNTTLDPTSTIVVSTVTLPTRDAVKTEEPATPVSQAKSEPETISPPSVPKGMRALLT